MTKQRNPIPRDAKKEVRACGAATPSGTEGCKRTVASRVGAWIETARIVGKDCFYVVASRVGAWIETGERTSQTTRR